MKSVDKIDTDTERDGQKDLLINPNLFFNFREKSTKTGDGGGIKGWSFDLLRRETRPAVF